MNAKIPIAIFVFDRPEILQETLDALSRNEGIEDYSLIFFCDGPKENSSAERLNNIQRVSTVIENITWTQDIKVYKKNKNVGLADSIVSGVSQVLETYDNIIVLEDDIKTAPYFLKYMRDALEIYKDCEDVASITGFNYPLENLNIDKETFFLRGTDCWGWATWKRGWELFEPDGTILLNKLKDSGSIYHFDFFGKYKFSKMLEKTIKVNHSWAVKWYASAYVANKVTLYPVKSLVQNIGDKGTNVKQNNMQMLGFSVSEKPIIQFEKNIIESEIMHKKISDHFGKYYNIFYRGYNFLEQKVRNLFNIF